MIDYLIHSLKIQKLRTFKKAKIIINDNALQKEKTIDIPSINPIKLNLRNHKRINDKSVKRSISIYNNAMSRGHSQKCELLSVDTYRSSSNNSSFASNLFKRNLTSNFIKYNKSTQHANGQHPDVVHYETMNNSLAKDMYNST